MVGGFRLRSRMARAPLTLAQQLVLCQQVARLVRSRLPISGELAKLAEGAAGADGQAARVVDQQVAQGKSLVEAMAADDSRNSRMLAACIEVGQRTGCLEQTLEAWTAMHFARSRYAKRLRAAMVYPVLLIMVTLLSLGYVIWRLIPEYRSTYVQFGEQLPLWLEWIVSAREQLGPLLLVLFVLIILPLGVWYWRRRSYDASGLPREVPQRLTVQGLVGQLLSVGVKHGLPLNELLPFSVLAGGGSRADAQRAFSQLQQRQPIPGLAPHATLLLAALYGGVTEQAEASQLLEEAADHLRQQAEDRAQQNERWLPMLVAISVGLLTILTYVFLIYLPWIALMQRLVTG